MHKTTLNLAALIAAALLSAILLWLFDSINLLSACGGGSDDAITPRR